MARFKCTNNECKLKDKIFTPDKVRYTADSTGALHHNITCSKCGSAAEEVKEERDGSPINVYFASFSSKSDEEKKAILKKRASEHNRTKMKDRTIAIKRKLIGR
jgi:transcription initiation factor IIE alpha subunit